VLVALRQQRATHLGALRCVGLMRVFIVGDHPHSPVGSTVQCALQAMGKVDIVK
jgi:hypothetical protein